MFDFNTWKSSEKSIHDSGQPKQSLRRLEVSLNKCINVVIPLHVEILNKHKTNIEKFHELQEWNNVLREQVNASRTVEQLKADIWSLDLLRNQLIEEDLKDFDKRTTHAQNMVIDSVKAFIESSNVPNRNSNPFAISDNHTSEDSESEHLRRQRHLQDELLMLETEEVLKEELEKKRAIAATWNQLVKDLQDFHEIMTTFASCVHKQQEAVNLIEENIESAEVNVVEGNRFLAQAVKYKAALYPVTGAVIGGCLGGPVGLLVGLKAGAAALAVGGFIGFQGGRILKRKTTHSADTELHDLSTTESSLNKRTSSLPDLRAVNGNALLP